MTHTRHRSQRAAFTIVELIVAMAVASLLLFLVNTIFNSTVRAVSRGIALSDIIANARGASDQIRLDADQMMAPDSTTPAQAGVLVIVNQTIDAPIRRGPRADEQLRDASHPLGPVRSDQLMFVRDAAGLRSVTPGSTGDYGNTVSAAHAKVWYGHVRKTNPDGTDGGLLGANGPNRSANDWVLGRQAMLLADTSPGSIYAASAAHDAAVTGLTPPAGIAANAYSGLTDVAAVNITALHADPASGCYITERLRTNLSPVFDATNDDYAFSAWQIAQMHTAFLTHVSDYVVEFAGDYDSDGRVDTSTATSTILWYSMLNPPATKAPTTVGSASVFTWQEDDDGASSTWPHLIRVRYRVHDPRGSIESGFDRDGVQQHGLWFEHILRVNRP